MAKEFLVTPWEVTGEVDYNKLIKEFGTRPLTDDLIKLIEKKAGKSNSKLHSRRLAQRHMEPRYRNWNVVSK